MRRLFSLVARAFAVIAGLMRGLKQRLSPVNLPEPNLEESSAETNSDDVVKRSFLGRLALWARKRTRHCANISRPYDEADAVKFTGNDLSILISADSLQSDDELLGTAISDALKQSQPTLAQTTTFLLGALQSRIPSERRRWQLEEEPASLLDCRSLTLRARTAIVDIVAQTSSDQLRQAAMYFEILCMKSAELQWILCILVSPSQYPLPAAGLQFLGTCILEFRTGSSKLLDYIRRMSAEQPDQTLCLLLTATRHVCMNKGLTSDAAENTVLASALRDTKTILTPYFTAAGLPELRFQCAVFDDHMGTHNNWRNTLNESSLEETVIWISEVLQQELELHGTQRLPPELLEDAMSLIFRLCALIGLDLDYISGLSILTNLVNRLFTHGGRSAEHLELALWCYVSQPAFFIRRHPPGNLVDNADEEGKYVLSHTLKYI